MIKCPNCGSAASMRFIDSWKTSDHLREIWDCCDCKKRFSFFYSLKLEFMRDITPKEGE